MTARIAPCPVCHSQVGKPCTTRAGKPTTPHTDRRRAEDRLETVRLLREAGWMPPLEPTAMFVTEQVCAECKQPSGAPIHDAHLSVTATGEAQHPYIPGPMIDRKVTP